MGVRVFYSEISGSKEVKKRQQRVMMILESKNIPFEALDITEPGKEKEKDFMLANAKPRGDSKIILAPQVFNDDRYCGDYEDFDLANENDNLEEFLGSPKIENNIQTTEKAEVVENGKPGSREPSAEVEAKTAEATNGASTTDEPGDTASSEPQTEETTAEATPSEEKPPEEKESGEAAGDTSAPEPSSKTEEGTEADGADE